MDSAHKDTDQNQEMMQLCDQFTPLSCETFFEALPHLEALSATGLLDTCTELDTTGFSAPAELGLSAGLVTGC